MAGKAASKRPAPASTPSAFTNLAIFSVLMFLVPVGLFFGASKGYLDRESNRHRALPRSDGRNGPPR
jgi:hypothetical protein